VTAQNPELPPLEFPPVELTKDEIPSYYIPRPGTVPDLNQEVKSLWANFFDEQVTVRQMHKELRQLQTLVKERCILRPPDFYNSHHLQLV
jgi:hypothetical protein